MTSATEWKFFLMAFKYMIGSWASDIKWSIAWRQRDMRRITLLYHHPTQEQLHTAYHIKWKKNILCMYDTQILLFSCPFHFNAHITPPGLTLDTCTKIVFFSCLKFFFLMWTTLKISIEFVTILLLFLVLVFWPQGTCELSFLTRDWTIPPPLEGKVLTTGPPGSPQKLSWKRYIKPSNKFLY